jgi:hypothetical protein
VELLSESADQTRTVLDTYAAVLADTIVSHREGAKESGQSSSG